jgi:hypothetical protein
MIETAMMKEKLPELCFVFINGKGPGKRIGIVKRGETGYYQTDYDNCVTASNEIAKQAVDELNARLKVTKAQALAMEAGSMFGWHVPGANPDNWTRFTTEER